MTALQVPLSYILAPPASKEGFTGISPSRDINTGRMQQPLRPCTAQLMPRHNTHPSLIIISGGFHPTAALWELRDSHLLLLPLLGPIPSSSDTQLCPQPPVQRRGSSGSHHVGPAVRTRGTATSQPLWEHPGVLCQPLQH